MGSDFLFAMPSTLSGVARSLDLGGTFDSYNSSQTGEEADRKALTSDWRSVGKDLHDAMEKFEADQHLHAPRDLALVEG